MGTLPTMTRRVCWFGFMLSAPSSSSHLTSVSHEIAAKEDPIAPPRYAQSSPPRKDAKRRKGAASRSMHASIASASRRSKAGSSSSNGSSTARMSGGATYTIGAPGAFASSQGRIPGKSVVTTLQPHARASITTSGNPSKNEGRTNMSARRYACAKSVCESLPRNTTSETQRAARATIPAYSSGSLCPPARQSLRRGDEPPPRRALS